MDTGALKKFAQVARRQLLDQVAARMEQVLQTDSVEIREKEKTVNVLREQIKQSSKEAVVDQVAYTWFNRFCALRYMDVNNFTHIGIVSPQEGFTQPEILQEAKQGVIDDSIKVDKKIVVGLLNGQLPSSSPQQEAYRLLLVGACNAYHSQMPFLFPQIDDYTELLMPDDLLSENSVLQGTRETLTKDACRDVEVIGWLYQFYISERKDEVFASKKTIEPEDIPAVTQLFTPHYIVRYLVENSLGRLWMLNHPGSNLVKQMDYYVQLDEPGTDYLKIQSPEEIKVCDPACGSGHMLTYAFELLYAIYEEQGYDAVQIPTLILQHNLYGIEIDQRAGHMAAFALMMKGREKDRRFFSREITPNICVLESINFAPNEIETYKKAIGSDLFTQDLWFLTRQFENANNFGSLICPQVQSPAQILSGLEELDVFKDLFLMETNSKVKLVLKFSQYLSSRYHIVITNPPYLNPSNTKLKSFAKDQYPDTKSDLGVMFIERIFDMVKTNGFSGMITLQSWMFLSSFNKFRRKLLTKETILTMAHLGTRGFDSIGGEVVSTTAFIMSNTYEPNLQGKYLRLVEGKNEIEKQRILLDLLKYKEKSSTKNYFSTTSNSFQKIPGDPIAYWLNTPFINAISSGTPLGEIVPIKSGMSTTDNNRFLRLWPEVSLTNTGFLLSSLKQAKDSQKKWFPFKKGGSFRRWYGNNDYLLNWYNNGEEIKHAVVNNPSDPNTKHWSRRIFGVDYFFKHGITWTKIASSKFSCRIHYDGYIFSDASNGAFPKDDIPFYLALLNSKVVFELLIILAPTLNIKAGDISKIPLIPISSKKEIVDIANQLCDISEQDWNSYETSWNFQQHPLLGKILSRCKLENTYQTLRSNWFSNITKTKELEEANNQIFIDVYGLESEINPIVPIEEITLTCNPNYRYAGDKTETEFETILLADTMKEFISYAVGCMLGRYSLDKEGLILASAGETLNDYTRKVPESTFKPDADNVIPVLEGEWFVDDIAERFKDFLKVTFGEENFEENLAFLEQAIGRDIRGYFIKDFYKEHIKMYKKRPIYWLFSSPKGSFNALVYMHRYNKHTVSVILNDYLVQYRTKLSARKAMLENRSISASASQGEKTKALKEIDKINSILAELREYEDEILYPLATQQIEIDLDDGVKINYNKFGKALKKVSGLSD